MSSDDKRRGIQKYISVYYAIESTDVVPEVYKP